MALGWGCRCQDVGKTQIGFLVKEGGGKTGGGGRRGMIIGGEIHKKIDIQSETKLPAGKEKPSQPCLKEPERKKGS